MWNEKLKYKLVSSQKSFWCYSLVSNDGFNTDNIFLIFRGNSQLESIVLTKDIKLDIILW